MPDGKKLDPGKLIQAIDRTIGNYPIDQDNQLVTERRSASTEEERERLSLDLRDLRGNWALILYCGIAIQQLKRTGSDVSELEQKHSDALEEIRRSKETGEPFGRIAEQVCSFAILVKDRLQEAKDEDK